MKKIYALTFISLAWIGLVAQTTSHQTSLPDDNIEMEDESNDLDPEFYAKKSYNNKAFGDTLYYQDFANGLPMGWSILNNNPNNFQWEWNTVYQQGQFSSTRTEIKSTTAANGFMSLPSDFYNTPTPTTGRVNMDTYFESEVINISPKPSVWVSYQQYLRYCCNSSNRLVLQVSTDNFITFTEFDAKDGLPVNAGNTTNAVGGTTNIINISTAVANASSFKVRFYANGNGRYFWMIDDFAVIEGVENDLELTDPYMEFNQANYTYYPFYGQIPYDLFPPLPFFGRIYNNGSNTQTNVRLEATVTHTADAFGNPGSGLIYSTSQNTFPTSMVSGSVSDSVVPVLTGNPRFVPLVLGEFQVDFLATSDSVDGNLGNETAVASFRTTDTTFARDDNGFGGGTGPGSYVRGGQSGGTTVGDQFATMYIVESRTGNGGPCKIPTSITYFVTADVQNIGVEIVPKIWAYNEDSLNVNGSFSVDRAFGAEVASSFIPYTVLSTDTNSFVTIPLDNGSAVINGLDTGQYAVGWEVTNTNGGNSFEVANDATSAALQSSVTSFNNHGHSPGWGWVAVNPVIRLNLGNPCPVGIINESEDIANFSVVPNPNNGQFQLNLTSSKEANYTLAVRNAIGQSVLNENITVQNEYRRTFNFSDLEKGVYFVSVENQSNKWIEKVIIQ